MGGEWTVESEGDEAHEGSRGLAAGLGRRGKRNQIILMSTG